MPKYADLSAGHVRDYVPVTPNNSTDNLKANTTDVVVGFYIGGNAGNLVVTIDGTDRTIPVVANQYVPCTGATRLKTATTATSVFALVI